jgi:predicted class III extradiol MEMO1 family dioxygenase
MSRSAVRPAAVAGSFYPGVADELATVVDRLLERVRLCASEGGVAQAPVALVAPHAGYIYSGAVAAFATPIGEVPVEMHTCSALAARHECVTVDDHPHRREHSIAAAIPAARADSRMDLRPPRGRRDRTGAGG